LTVFLVHGTIKKPTKRLFNVLCVPFVFGFEVIERIVYVTMGTQPQPRPTPAIEDYLGAIYTLDRDGEVVIGRKLAEWLEVSAPTVTETIQRMIRDEWVTMDEDKTIHLTEAGRKAAASVLRRHMLTELLLAKVLGVPWSKVHEEAHRLEHAFSTETTARVAKVVNDASVCPHGNPLPGREEVTSHLLPLLEAKLGCSYILARISEEAEQNPKLMTYLEKHGLVPGAEVSVIEILPYNETVTVCCNGQQVVLGLAVARKLWVSEGVVGRPKKRKPTSSGAC
jgi:DtxR family Mn-dependent transcriptional regulator